MRTLTTLCLLAMFAVAIPPLGACGGGTVPSCQEACEKPWTCNPHDIACLEGYLPPEECGLNVELYLAHCVNSCEEDLADDNIFKGFDEEFLLCYQEYEWGCGEVAGEVAGAICACHGICTKLARCQLLDRYGVAEGTEPAVAIDQCDQACQSWVEEDYARLQSGQPLADEHSEQRGGYRSCRWLAQTCEELSAKTCFGVAE